MGTVPVTIEEKRLVGHLKKKKAARVGKRNVYFNKSNKGKSTYIQGKVYSHKNDCMMQYRSSYELKFFMMLEEDDDVLSYRSEPLALPYVNSEGKHKVYIPDVLAVHSDGLLGIYEIKPQAMLSDIDVRLKARACIKHFRDIYEPQGVQFKYKFITEKHLFKSNKEYTDFVRMVKSGVLS